MNYGPAEDAGKSSRSDWRTLPEDEAENLETQADHTGCGDIVREIRSGVQRAASSAMGVPVMIRVDASREPLAGSGPRLGSIACPVATFVRARLAACCKVEPKSLHENAKLNTI